MFSLMNNLFGWMGWNRGRERQRAVSQRLQAYDRYLRSYQGYSVRGALNTGLVQDWHRIKFNFVQPVVNLSAGWFASKPLDFDVDGSPEATAACYAIWDRSGSERTLLENAIACGIYGEVAGLATQNAAGEPLIEFVDPRICNPSFDGADYSTLRALEIAYEAVNEVGDTVTRREIWERNQMESYPDDGLERRITYAELPAVWIRNASVKGVPYGFSDVEPILDLVEEYDHIASKQTRIIDYYAAPTIVFKGLQSGNMDKTVGTAFYLPTDGDVKFLEWSGSAPDVEKQLTRIRNGISEVSQVPAIAFGQQDSGLSNLSGVALQILFGPLTNKTERKQAQWGPCLERLLWICLRNGGFPEVRQEQVNVRFPSGTPVDGQSSTAIASAKIAAKMASRRTVMNDMGIEDPDAELERIVLEERLLQQTEPLTFVQRDANSAARSGARGLFATEVVQGGGLPGD